MGRPDWDINKADTALQTGVPIQKDGVIALVVVANMTYHVYVAINSKSNTIQSFGVGSTDLKVRSSTIIRVSKGDILYVGAGNDSLTNLTWLEDGSTTLNIGNVGTNNSASATWGFYPLK